MAAALRRWDGVAIGTDEAVLVERPADRPFRLAAAVIDAAGEGMLRDRRPRGDHGRQVIGESAGKVEGLRFRRAVVLVGQGGRTGPADLDAPEKNGRAHV